MKVRQIPIEKLHPNPWNPNRQSAVVQRAERESIRHYGFIDPITVRPHPDAEDEFQIIDGEHRWGAAKDEGLAKVPAVVLEVEEATARKLTIVLNETKGEAEPLKMAMLLGELKMELPAEEFEMALPWDAKELERIMTLPVPTTDTDEAWFTIQARAPEDFGHVWNEVLQAARAEGISHEKPAIEAGMVLEMLAANYLAGR